MKYLATAVGAFAAATLAVGTLRPDIYILLLAAAAIGSAVTTFRAARISMFLRIFAAIFAVETLLFGACFLVNRLGLWPKAYADLLPPDSLALTVALFGSLIYAISYAPIVRKMTAIADPYFHDAAPTVARSWPKSLCDEESRTVFPVRWCRTFISRLNFPEHTRRKAMRSRCRGSMFA